MKRNHKIEVAGKKLTLSLSFATSLDILDEVASPSDLMLDILTSNAQRRAGRALESRPMLNERSAVQLIAIGNRDHEGLTEEELGNLAFKHGMFQFFGLVTDYLAEIVHGQAPEVENLEEFVEEEGEAEGTGKN